MSDNLIITVSGCHHCPLTIAGDLPYCLPFGPTQSNAEYMRDHAMPRWCPLLTNFRYAAIQADCYAGEMGELQRPSDYIIPSEVPGNQLPIIQAGYVYLMLNQRNGYHKIGYSKNPQHRERTLQAEEPEIELLASWPGSFADEKWLHIRFAEKRIRGEWFNLTPEDVEWLKGHAL